MADTTGKLVLVTVEVPPERRDELYAFAAKLRGEHPSVSIIFSTRPNSELRRMMKELGLSFSPKTGTWGGTIAPSSLTVLREAVTGASGALKIGAFPAKARSGPKTKPTAFSNGRLREIREVTPFTNKEAQAAVDAVFAEYKRHEDPRASIARDTKSKLRSHWVFHEAYNLYLPKKPVMYLALKKMKRIETWVTSSSFNTSEASDFFDFLGMRHGSDPVFPLNPSKQLTKGLVNALPARSAEVPDS
jgi:hypothetical protein